MTVLLRLIAIAAMLQVAAPMTAYAQIASTEGAKLSAEALARIPPDLRDRYLALIQDVQRAERDILDERVPDRLRWTILHAIARLGGPSDMDFVFKQMPSISPSRRAGLIGSMFQRDDWQSRPGYMEFLFDELANDKDIEPLATVLDIFRKMAWKPSPKVAEALQARMEKEEKAGNTAAVMSLGRLEERWQKFNEGLLVPSAFQEPPPVFDLKLNENVLRVLIFGDFGNGRPSQHETAAAMRGLHRKTKFDFGITTGDNFYTVGMMSPSDKVWKDLWEDMYGPMKIPFYASLGNHDWDPAFGEADKVPAQILYTHKSPTWRMPATHYTYTAGPAQFFVVNTQALSAAHLAWLRQELARSTARWKIVYGHVPLHVSMQGSTSTAEFARGPLAKLQEIVQGKIDLYIAGHHHSLQHIRPEGSTHYMVSGGGGASEYEVAPQPGSHVLFARSTLGFSSLEIARKDITLRFFDTQQRELYQGKISKP